jgi:Ca-activated chloride channel family protein
MKPSDNDRRITRFLAGDMTEQEEKKLFDDTVNDPQLAAELEELSSTWQLLNDALLSDANKHAPALTPERRSAILETPALPEPEPIVIGPWLLGIAAAATVTLGFTFLMTNSRNFNAFESAAEIPVQIQTQALEIREPMSSEEYPYAEKSLHRADLAQDKLLADAPASAPRWKFSAPIVTDAEMEDVSEELPAMEDEITLTADVGGDAGLEMEEVNELAFKEESALKLPGIVGGRTAGGRKGQRGGADPTEGRQVSADNLEVIVADANTTVTPSFTIPAGGGINVNGIKDQSITHYYSGDKPNESKKKRESSIAANNKQVPAPAPKAPTTIVPIEQERIAERTERLDAVIRRELLIGGEDGRGASRIESNTEIAAAEKETKAKIAAPEKGNKNVPLRPRKNEEDKALVVDTIGASAPINAPGAIGKKGATEFQQLQTANDIYLDGTVVVNAITNGQRLNYETGTAITIDGIDNAATINLGIEKPVPAEPAVQFEGGNYTVSIGGVLTGEVGRQTAAKWDENSSDDVVDTESEVRKGKLAGKLIDDADKDLEPNNFYVDANGEKQDEVAKIVRERVRELEMDKKKAEFLRATTPAVVDAEKLERDEEVDGKLARGRVFLENKRYVDAREELEQVLLKDPYNVDATHMLKQINEAFAEHADERRQVMRSERLAEIAWKWSDPFEPLVNVETRSFPANDALVAQLQDRARNGKIGDDDADESKRVSELETAAPELLFRDYGIAFEQGASITFNNDTRSIEITNTPEELEKSAQLIDSLKNAPVQHRVQPGDTLYAIAKANDVTVSQLKTENSLVSDLIRPNQLLTIPKANLVDAGTADDPLPPPPTEPPPPVNPFTLTANDAQSTFALESENGSWNLMRKYVSQGYLPPAATVRMEEFVNYFDYNYAPSEKQVFSVHASADKSAFGKNLSLIKIGVQGKVIGRDGEKAAHLVFLVDTSGSMGRADRLPLVQEGISMALDQLKPTDRVTLITYGVRSRLLLESVPAAEKDRIRTAIKAIETGEATNMAEGIRTAYDLAARHYRAGQVNRIVLCSDGVANIGPAEADDLLATVKQYRTQGISFTSVGVGAGAYDDRLMEQLANQGDGQYVYLDSRAEVRRTFVDNFSATLNYIARNVKIQVEFNPDLVRRYRLIGYENRDVADKDFRNDKVDAGEIGSGQSATALYEIETFPHVHTGRPTGSNGTFATVRVRHMEVDTDDVHEFARDLDLSLIRNRPVAEDPYFHLAACAAEFAEILRHSEYSNHSLQQLEQRLIPVANALPLDQRVQEFLQLLRQAQNLPEYK